jgi:hypothetical protein
MSDPPTLITTLTSPEVTTVPCHVGTTLLFGLGW